MGLRDFSGFDSLVGAKTRRNDSMAWTEITRAQYRRDGPRCASGTTDEKWALSAALLAISHAEQIECFLLKLRCPCHDGKG